MAAEPQAHAGDEERAPVSVAATPRAAASVRRMKSWGGLVGFGLVLLASSRQGLPLADAALRALAGGIVGFLAAWTGGVAVWRHLLRAQTAVAARQAATARRERQRRAAAAAREAESS